MISWAKSCYQWLVKSTMIPLPSGTVSKIGYELITINHRHSELPCFVWIPHIELTLLSVWSESSLWIIKCLFDEDRDRGLFLACSWQSRVPKRTEAIWHKVKPSWRDKLFHDLLSFILQTEPPGGDDDPMGAYRGEIIIALKFVPSTSDLKSKSSRQVRKTRGMLMVLIKEAKNLVPLKGSANTDPFCKW